jgi:hypothetical protein
VIAVYAQCALPELCHMCRRFAAVRRIADIREFNNSLSWASELPSSHREVYEEKTT